MKIFIVAAVVLAVLAVIATATATSTALGVTWATWICAALLAYFVDLLFGWTWTTPWRAAPPPQP